jgi:lactoylglutathione lyase
MSGDILQVGGVLIWTERSRFQAMRDFYVETLGLTPRSDRDGFVNFSWREGTSEFRLTISVHDEVTGATREPLRQMLNLTVEDVQPVYERLTALGVAFSRPPEQEPWGGWVATFADPDGNTVQLLRP